MTQANPNRTVVRTEPQQQQAQSSAESRAPGTVVQQPPSSAPVVFKDFASI